MSRKFHVIVLILIRVKTGVVLLGLLLNLLLLLVLFLSHLLQGLLLKHMSHITSALTHFQKFSFLLLNVVV